MGYDTSWTMRKREERKAQGLCPRCGKRPPAPGKVECKACQVKQNAGNKQRAAAATVANVCQQCHIRPPVEGKKFCQDCLSAATARTMSRRAARIKRGLCPTCGGWRDVAGRLNCQKCLAERIAGNERRIANGLCPKCGQPWRGETQSCPACLAALAAVRQVLKDEVFTAYGGYKCNCQGCGVIEPVFLQIDHINHDGAAHRRQINATGGNRIYYWLKQHGFPAGFQVLCANCNRARQFGPCPHQLNREVTEHDVHQAAPSHAEVCGRPLSAD